MRAYTSRTGTARNLEALRAAGWRLLVSAAADLRHEGFRYALDNGAWSYFQQGVPFDERRFERAVDLLAERADWTVVPDVVGDAVASLELTARWLPQLPIDRAPHVLVAVQDGMTPADVEGLVPPHCRIGLFLGGSTEWKLATMQEWGEWCRARGTHYHVARVNTVRRIRTTALALADSFDGSSPARYAVNLPRLDAARRLGTVFEPAQSDDLPSFEDDADFVRGELATYRDDEEVTLSAGALRALLRRERALDARSAA